MAPLLVTINIHHIVYRMLAIFGTGLRLATRGLMIAFPPRTLDACGFLIFTFPFKDGIDGPFHR